MLFLTTLFFLSYCVHLHIIVDCQYMSCEKGKATKLFKDDLEDDDFLSDIYKGEEILSEDESDMPLRRGYVTGATVDREDTLPPILIDEISDDEL
ncbi:hypothetical protein R1flu_000938 [Riccia fluitans]|uniref:Uncharacterized protein n=1 Tax=Riccia fluitans TaxID=41844 RepID=A0ABD1Y221_9MARC